MRVQTRFMCWIVETASGLMLVSCDLLGDRPICVLTLTATGMTICSRYRNAPECDDFLKTLVRLALILRFPDVVAGTNQSPAMRDGEAGSRSIQQNPRRVYADPKE